MTRILWSTILLCLLLLGGRSYAQDDNNPLPYVQREPAYDVAPQFPGGSNAMMQYFADSIRYPEPELTQRKQGTVIMACIVTRKGEVTAIRAVNGVPGAPNFIAEATRVLESMPRWTPARKGNKRVDAEMQVSIPFRPGRVH